MVLPSHLPGSWNVDALLARIRGFSRVLALLPIFAILLAPATVWGDIYKWTDEQGHTVVSNVQPANPNRVSDLKLLATETRSASPVLPSQQEAARTEQALVARIENLERQLQAQQYAQEPELVSQPAYSGDYYPAPAPPPPEPSGYSGYDPGYDPSYYGPWPLSYSAIAIAVPVRTVVRRPPVVSPTPVFVRPNPVLMGPNPVLMGPNPMFVGPNPMFVGPTPVFVNGPAIRVSHGASFGGRSMQRGGR